jgi:nucleoside-diphosphate-sugar epimerase
VLVIGGTGFIGGPTVRRLVERGHDVSVFHRGERAAELPRGVSHFLGDRKRIRDRDNAALRAWRPDVVVDFVAFNEADVRGVLDVFRGVARRLVVLSSLDVYRAWDRLTRAKPGPPVGIPMGEDAALREVPFPRRRSASSPEDIMWDYDKIPVERATRSEPTLPGTVLRLPAVYGPGDHKRHRVGNYLARMNAGTDALELDEGLSRWRWTRGYVEDVADAIALAAVDPRAQGRTYNVGEAAPLTEGAWVRAIARVAGYAGTIVERRREELPADVARELDEQDFAQDVVIDTSRIQAELGWSPCVPLDEGLAASIAWERAVAARARAAGAV